MMNTLQQIKDKLVERGMEEKRIFIQAGRRCGKDYLTLLALLKKFELKKSDDLIDKILIRRLSTFETGKEL
ncbi:hypothetical protein LCGC14_2100220 [marine sediment metagenome]|uniref:Uncharacterized protein n=1 Tax=marine sediment metagenome TaxID=412755 RepID=A0A0F9EAB6_9ZZZZ